MNILTIKDVKKSFGNIEVLKGISFNIEQGEIYGLLGPNGAGKTTLMKILVKLSRQTEGTIFYKEKSLDELSNAMLKEVGNIIEYPSFYKYLTAKDNLYLHCDYMEMDYSGVMEMIDLVGLKGKENMSMRKYSLGMKQRLALARCMLHKPKLLVLDEPINGLDPIGIKEIRNLLLKLKNEFGTTILISSHILSEIALIADRVGVINDGLLIDETELKGHINSQELEDYYISLISGEAKK